MPVKAHSVFGGDGLVVSAPDACQVGPYVFLSARFGVNLDAGGVPMRAVDVPDSARATLGSRYIDAMEWPVTAQTWWIYEAFRRLLKPSGADLTHLVRTNTYFRDLEDFTAMERTRAVLLPVAPPASTVLEVPFGHFPAGVDVAIEGVAVLPGQPREAIRCPAVGVADHYSWGIRTSDIVWVTGQTPTHPLRLQYVEKAADIGLDHAQLATGNPHTAQREGPTTAQAWMAYWRVRKIVEDAGARVEDVLHEKVYLRSTEYLPAVERAYRTLYPDPEAAPPRIYLEVCNIGRTRDCRLEIDTIAVRGDRRAIAGDTDGLGRLGAAAGVGGPFLSLGGRVARDPGTGRVIRSADELGARGRALDGETSLLAVQALWIYDRLARFLTEHDSSLGELAKIELFVKDGARVSALDAVHRVVFADGRPAMSVVPVVSVDPDPEAHIKISGFATRPTR